MHHGDRAIAAGVWVGVAVGRRAVGGPAGVAHPGGAGQRMRGDLLVQVGQLAGAALDGQAAVEDGHPGAVVAAILQSAQAVHDDTQRLLIPDVPNDSTHVLSVTGPVGTTARNRRTGGGQSSQRCSAPRRCSAPVSYTHLRAHETDSYLVCRLLLEKKK